MGIISLITDFGLSDNFVGVMKAVISNINPAARIIDISHGVSPQDICQAAFLLKSSFNFFPSNTVHLVVVDPGVGSLRKKIIVKTKRHYFIAPDNGVLSLALEEEPPVEIIEITNEKYFLKPVSGTFHGRDIFSPITAYLSKGYRPEEFGKRIRSFRSLTLPEIKIQPKELIGEIVCIDRFGNLISNIDEPRLRKFIKNKRYKIIIKGKSIHSLSCGYFEQAPKKILALINSFNNLEIAINSGSAKEYLKAKKHDKIKIIII